MEHENQEGAVEVHKPGKPVGETKAYPVGSGREAFEQTNRL